MLKVTTLHRLLTRSDCIPFSIRISTLDGSVDYPDYEHCAMRNEWLSDATNTTSLFCSLICSTGPQIVQVVNIYIYKKVSCTFRGLSSTMISRAVFLSLLSSICICLAGKLHVWYRTPTGRVDRAVVDILIFFILSLIQMISVSRTEKIMWRFAWAKAGMYFAHQRLESPWNGGMRAWRSSFSHHFLTCTKRSPREVSVAYTLRSTSLSNILVNTSANHYTKKRYCESLFTVGV